MNATRIETGWRMIQGTPAFFSTLVLVGNNATDDPESEVMLETIRGSVLFRDTFARQENGFVGTAPAKQLHGIEILDGHCFPGYLRPLD